MTFNIYIRVIIEAFLVAAISAYSEIKNTSFKDGILETSIISLIISITVVIVLHVTILLNIFELWRLRDMLIIEDDSYFTEFFSGLKEDNSSRTFNVGNMIRRSLLALWVVEFTFLPSLVVIIVFSIMQLMFAIFTVILRPYILQRDNVKE
jgi:hypothetical protein